MMVLKKRTYTHIYGIRSGAVARKQWLYLSFAEKVIAIQCPKLRISNCEYVKCMFGVSERLASCSIDFDSKMLVQ